MSVLTRENSAAIAQAATWLTAVTVGAGDGILVENVSGLDETRELVVEKPYGVGLAIHSSIGPEQAVTVDFDVSVNEDAAVPMLLLAAILGDDTISGAADPYTHTMEMQDTTSKLLTFVMDEGSQVLLVNTGTVEELRVSFGEGGVMKFSPTIRGDGRTVGAGSELASVTYETFSPIFQIKSAVLRMNSQSGAALASGDEIEVTDLEITISRPNDGGILASGNTSVLEPVQGAFPTVNLSFQIPYINTAATTLHTAYGAMTAQKADIVISGSTGSRSLTLEFSNLLIDSITNDRGDTISTTVNLTGLKAASIPTGLTSAAPICAIWSSSLSTVLVT